MEVTDRDPAPVSVGVSPRAEVEPPGLVCNEVWGGNRHFFGPIELPGIRGALFSQPSGGARGGDVHYLSVCGSGLISRACLADVVGHGESVAAVSQTMHELLRRSVNRPDARKVLRRLNLSLLALEEESFTTAAVLTYIQPMRRLSLSYAGHEPAWYYTPSSGCWSRLESPPRSGLYDVPLAVDRKTRYSHQVQRVTPGDRLLLVTDGVLEAPDETGELFGRERLAEVLQGNGTGSPKEQVGALIAALREYGDGAPLDHDDVSVLMVEFVDNLKSSAVWTALQNRIFRRFNKRRPAHVAGSARS